MRTKKKAKNTHQKTNKQTNKQKAHKVKKKKKKEKEKEVECKADVSFLVLMFFKKKINVCPPTKFIKLSQMLPVSH